MKIGCCGSTDMGVAVKAAGYDYLECAGTSLLGDQDETAFAPVLAAYRALPLPVPVFNVFLPRDLKIVGPSVDHARVNAYLKRSIERVQRLGGSIIIFGSAGARNIPEGYAHDAAMKQLMEFLHGVADVADGSGVTVSIESLNRGENNVINSVAEACELARQVARPSISAMADLYHMVLENEPLSHLVEYASWIKHIHVADTGRLAPGTGQYPYAEFSRLLRKIGYDDRVSVECQWSDFAAQATPALRYLRGVF